MNAYTMPGFEKLERSPENILYEAARFFGTTTAYIVKPLRNRERAFMRFMIYLAMREKYNYTYAGIGQLFNKDHTTVVHGVQTIRDLLSVYPDRQEYYNQFNHHLNTFIK